MRDARTILAIGGVVALVAGEQWWLGLESANETLPAS